MTMQPAKRIRGGLPRKPLAVCLAAALALGIWENPLAADTPSVLVRSSSSPNRAYSLTSALGDLPVGSRKRAAWEKALKFHSPKRPATTLEVTNCDDSGSGSLRDTIAGAADGDTVDMTQLTCSTISVNDGAIIVAVDNLTLVGPGASALYIDTRAYNQLPRSSDFYHLGTGTLEIEGLKVGGAAYAGASRPSGGCIFSEGSVALVNSELKSCYLRPPAGTTAASVGGGVYAADGIYLNHSYVHYSNAYSPSSVAIGGGLYSKNGFTSKYSVIAMNAVTSGNAAAFGGAIVVADGTTEILNTTIFGNYSDHNIGGIDILGGTSVEIANSTISGNISVNTGGGIVSAVPLTLSNSTVVFNTEVTTGNYNYIVAAGVDLYNAALNAQSSLVAENLAYANPGHPFSDVGGYNATIVGANNLVRFAYLQMPGDTIYADPLLVGLGNYGGPTPTVAISASSPAVNAGNNVGGFDYDQRGAGYARVIGANADIGAFEVNSGNLIFANGFD